MAEEQSQTELVRQLAEARKEHAEGDSARLEQILHSADLDSLVRQALCLPAATVRDVSSRQVHGGIGVGTSVFVVKGTAHNRGQVRPWTIIVKTLSRLPGQDDQRLALYWKREAAFLSSALAQEMEVGLRPPRCFAVQPVAEDEIALWLEHVPHQSALWTDALYYRAAHKLGQFNGHWYGADRWLNERWMNQQRGFVEAWFPMVDGGLDAIEARWASYRDIGISLNDGFPTQLRRAWDRCMKHVQIYKAAPQTLCHFDAHRNNLLWNDERPDDLVAIDWAYVGPGALGQEIVVMVVNRMNTGGDFALDRLHSFGHQLYSHYAEGLRQVGWDGRDDEVRIGYLASATVFWIGMIVQALARVLPRDQAEQAAVGPVQDRVSCLWEYFRGCASELDALVG
jgi:hypothetical protein